jgi:hypothetical protein
LNNGLPLFFNFTINFSILTSKKEAGEEELQAPALTNWRKVSESLAAFKNIFTQGVKIVLFFQLKKYLAEGLDCTNSRDRIRVEH